MSDRKSVYKSKPDPAPALSNIEAERAVLGWLLADDRAWLDVSERIRPDHFSDGRHQRIYRGLASLARQGRPLLRQLLLSEIGDESAEDDEIELGAYLAALQAGAPKEAVTEFIDAVLSTWSRRRGVEEADWLRNEFQQSRLSAVGSIEEIVSEGHRRLSSIIGDSGDEAVRIGDLADTLVSRTQEIWQSKRPAGMIAGLPFIDELIGPLLPAQVIGLGGLTASGKTALAVQWGYTLALSGAPGMMFSLEMEALEIATRVIARLAEMPANKFAEADTMNETEMERLIEMARRAREVPFYIDARPRPSVSTIQTRVARAQARHGIKFVVIDHLQYIRADNPKADQHERLAQVADDIKAMAKRLQIPVILLSHLNRYVDIATIKTGRDIRRPSLNHLFGSSAIEKAADAVLFVHRPWAILQDARPAKSAKHYNQWVDDCFKAEGKAEIILGKRRNGKGRGIRQCLFDDKLTWFSEVPRENEYVDEAIGM